MRNVLTFVVVVLLLFLVACAARATKVFVVEVSPYSMEYTPGQIHDYLRNRGFQRVKFRDFDSGIIVYERRTADTDEQHFRLKSNPQIEVVVRLEKIRHTFGKSEPRVIVYFNEDGRSSMSDAAAQEYNRLFEDVVARVGVDRVEVW